MNKTSPTSSLSLSLSLSKLFLLAVIKVARQLCDLSRQVLPSLSLSSKSFLLTVIIVARQLCDLCSDIIVKCFVVCAHTYST